MHYNYYLLFLLWSLLVKEFHVFLCNLSDNEELKFHVFISLV